MKTVHSEQHKYKSIHFQLNYCLGGEQHLKEDVSSPSKDNLNELPALMALVLTTF